MTGLFLKIIEFLNQTYADVLSHLQQPLVSGCDTKASVEPLVAASNREDENVYLQNGRRAFMH
jgi:hypothetical protein